MGTTEPQAWLVRGSKNYAFDNWMLESGYTAVDFREVGNLSVAKDLPAMRALLSPTMPEKSEKAVGNYAAQLNAFANRMSVGDIVVLPLKSVGRLAFGVVTGGYQYLSGSDVLNHVRAVDWKRPDVARTAINQDLLYSLGAFSTVVQISRNDAAYRLGRVLRGAEKRTLAHDRGPRSQSRRRKTTSSTRMKLLPATGRTSSGTPGIASSRS